MFVIVKVEKVFEYDEAEGKIMPNGNEEKMCLLVLDNGRMIPIPRKYIRYFARGDEHWDNLK